MHPSSGWAPRSPLPPHRLAKLANALGVSTPSPSTNDILCRPSSAASTVTSKYMLHVIPPVHLEDHDGYHAQFRRGTLVALQSTLQAQLLVIAREYALPSTSGVVLYLVTASPQSVQSSPMALASPCCDPDGREPGPRLSEEIWKHIWSRVLRAEQDEVIALSRSGTPNPPGLRLDPSLRPFKVIPARAELHRTLAYPITPSTSTGSFVSSHDKSALDPDTPHTSHSSDHDLPLPGLNSHSIIPILAKVEFDIDRRKATWYEPWTRSRRFKRAESRSSVRSDSRSRTLDSSSLPDEKWAPYDLKLVQRMHKPPFLRSPHDFDHDEHLEIGEYAPLSDSPDPIATARMTSMGGDPLGDVFGTDAETWSDIRAQSDTVRRKVDDPNVVDLALDASSLTALPEPTQVESMEANEVDEVRDIIHRISRPSLNISIPNSADSNRRSSPSTAGARRPALPHLVLVPKSPPNKLVDNDACFNDKDALSLELEEEYQRSRSPGEEKRGGTVFEDLDLGLDLGDDDDEYDENDPNDRRRSQYLMKAKLDEIERILSRFSPHKLKTAMLDEAATVTHRRNLSTASRSHSPADPLHNAWPSVPYTSVTNDSPTRPADQPPSPPRLALNGVSTGAPKAFMSTSSPPLAMATESQLRRRELEPIMYPMTIPSPSHQISIASDSPIPLSPDPFGRHPSVYEVDVPPVESYWDPVTQKFSHDPLGPSSSMSSIEDGSGSLTSAPSSRFSADSSSVSDPVDRPIKPSAPLVSVKSFKKLWRRSKSSPTSGPQPPTPGRASFQLSSSSHPTTPTDQLMAPSTITRGSNGKVHGQLYFDQTSRPSLSGSRPSSPAVLLNAPPQEKPSVRKSILKSWKSVTGAVSQQPMNGSEPRKSSERPVSNETIKARRPSVLDDSIPPSPQLPAQYTLFNHMRTGSSSLDHRKLTTRSKTGPGHHNSSASHDLLSVIPPGMVQAPGSPSQFPASPRDSQAGSQASFETSHFEIISPPKVYPNQSYTTLNHGS